MRSFGMVLLAAACGGVSEEECSRSIPKNPKQAGVAERLKQQVLSLATSSAEPPVDVPWTAAGTKHGSQDIQGLVEKVIVAYSKGTK